MKTWFASYYSSQHAEPVEATVLAVEDYITIGFCEEEGITKTIRWEMKDINASFDHSEQATSVVNIKNNSRISISDKKALEFIRQMQEEQSKPWYKKKKAKNRAQSLSIFLGIAAILVTAYLLIVPWLSEKLASAISIQTEEEFGNAVYDALNTNLEQDKEATALVNEFFAVMKVQTPYNIRVTVVKGDMINAFALPGGNIVVYSALLKSLKSYSELAALLSHEFTHVNNRHSTKSVFRQLGSRVFLGLLFGKFSSVTSVLVDQADRFKSLKYSRKLEKEADMEGLAILQERKIDAEGFVRLFQHLKESTPEAAIPEFLASHPDIESRINYIKKASANNVEEEHNTLKTIFEKLK